MNDSDSDNDHRIAHDTPKVMSLVVEKASNGSRVHVAVVDRQGLLLDHRHLDFLADPFGLRIAEQKVKFRKTTINNKLVEVQNETKQQEYKRHMKDRDRLMGMLKRQELRPNVVAIGASDPVCTSLRFLMCDIRAELKRKNRFEIIYMNMEVASIFAHSDRCPRDYKEALHKEVVMGLSMARMLQDPLAEHLNLWNDELHNNYLMQLKYHALQDMVSYEELQDELLNAICMSVAIVGVDVNKIEPLKHLHAPLQFISGLGPRKAAAVLAKMSAGNKVQMRKQLLIQTSRENESQSRRSYGDDDDLGMGGMFGPCVYYNCAAFIRLGLEKMDDEERIDPLDDTRIHPEFGYAYAIKICRDAQQDDDGHRRAVGDPILETFKHPEKIAELDIHAYSEILNRKGTKRAMPYLHFVVEEIQSPFKDRRYPWPHIPDEQLFFLINSEDSNEFRPACEVSAIVTDTQRNKAYVKLMPSTVRGYITDVSHILSMSNTHTQTRDHKHDHTHELKQILPNGKAISGRIVSIDYNTQNVAICVSQSRMQTILRHHFQAFRNLRYFSVLMNSDIEQPRSHLQCEDKKPIVRRQILHRTFKAISHGRMMKLLTKAPIGSGWFRPYENSTDKLLLYIKTRNQPTPLPFIKQVFESDQRMPGELGSKLRIDEKTYADLDEILHDFVATLWGNLDELYKHEKFRDSDKNTVLNELKQSHSQNPGSVMWSMVPDYDNPCRFTLLQVAPGLPGVIGEHSRHVVLEDRIYVTTRSFRLWLREEKSLRKLIDWWKTEGFENRKQIISEYRVLCHSRENTEASNFR